MEIDSPGADLPGARYDVARWLELLAARVRAGIESGAVTDLWGDPVGSFEFQSKDNPPR